MDLKYIQVVRGEKEYVIEKAILLYKEQGISGERFATTINRIGFEKVEKQLLDNDLLERKEEIINSL